jgi:hypothetical protein
MEAHIIIKDCRGTRDIGPDGKPEDDTGEFSPEDFD